MTLVSHCVAHRNCASAQDDNPLHGGSTQHDVIEDDPAASLRSRERMHTGKYQDLHDAVGCIKHGPSMMTTEYWVALMHQCNEYLGLQST